MTTQGSGTVGELNVALTGKAESLNAAIAKAKSDLNSVGDVAKQTGSKIDGSFQSAASSLVGLIDKSGTLGKILSGVGAGAGSAAGVVGGITGAMAIGDILWNDRINSAKFTGDSGKMVADYQDVSRNILATERQRGVNAIIKDFQGRADALGALADIAQDKAPGYEQRQAIARRTDEEQKKLKKEADKQIDLYTKRFDATYSVNSAKEEDAAQAKIDEIRSSATGNVRDDLEARRRSLRTQTAGEMGDIQLEQKFAQDGGHWDESARLGRLIDLKKEERKEDDAKIDRLEKILAATEAIYQVQFNSTSAAAQSNAASLGVVTFGSNDAIAGSSNYLGQIALILSGRGY